MHRLRPFVIMLLAATVAGCSLPSSKPPLPATEVAPNPVATQPAGGTPASDQSKLHFIQLHMVTEAAGWAETALGVVRTGDGWGSWEDVSPPGLPDPVRSEAGFFLDDQEAWYAVPDSKVYRVYHTTNGERSWSGTKPPGRISGRYWFFQKEADTRRGWALEYDVATGNMPVSVVRQVEGDSWELISPGESPRNPTSGPGALPYGCMKTGLHFRPDGALGWIPLECRSAKFELYISRDQGATWFPQQLPIPEELRSQNVSIYPPTFFDNQSGALLITFATADSGQKSTSVIFTSSDGGENWAPAPPLRHRLYQTVSALHDSVHWWVFADDSLHRTADGGQSWQSTPLDWRPRQLQFVSPTLGWAVTANDGRLFRTEDAGETWTLVNLGPKAVAKLTEDPLGSGWVRIPSDYPGPDQPMTAVFGPKPGQFLAQGKDGRIWVYSIDQQSPSVPLGKNQYRGFRISPDGACVGAVGKEDDIWMIDLHSGTEAPLGIKGEGLLAWRPDGKGFYFMGKEDGVMGIAEYDIETLSTTWHLRATAIDRKEVERFFRYPHPDGSLSADGTRLLLAAGHSGTGTLYMLNPVTGEFYRYEETSGDGFSPRWAPDDLSVYFGWGIMMQLDTQSREKKPLSLPPGTIRIQDVAPDGTILALSHVDGSMAWIIGKPQ